MTDIKWDEPIEAVHEDGAVVPMEFHGAIGKSFLTIKSPNGNQTNNVWLFNGEDCMADSGWRIRNVAKPEVEPVDNSEQLPPALVARMVALVRGMASCATDLTEFNEARAIVNDPGFPAEVDEDAELIEETAKAIYASYGYVKDWGHPDTVRVHHDHTRRAAAAAIRRGRELATRAAGEREVG